MKVAEWMHTPVDDHLKERLDRIFMAKERYAFELKQAQEAKKKAARGGVNRGSSTEECDTDSMPPPPVNTQAGIAVCVCEQLYIPVPTLQSFHIIGSYIDSTPAQLVNAQVINDAANAAALSIMEVPPEIGNRSPGIWSVCFQGGTFDRVKQR